MKNLFFYPALFFTLFSISISVCISGETSITITAVGDIMPGTSFPDESYLPPEEEGSLFRNLHNLFYGSDIVFGNLEGSLNNNEKCIKECEDPKKCFAFRIPEKFVSDFSKAGFNLFSIANNHIGDFGMPGRMRTAQLLTENKIHFAGITSFPYSVFEHNNVKYGFTAFAPNEGTNDIRNIESAKKIIRILDAQCDIIIVSFHGGAEGSENRHVTRETEFFYGEDRGNVYEFAHSVIDEGADIVLGHGPHITKAIELYKNRFITYSMGNFCTYARFNLLNHNGVAPVFRLKIQNDGGFISGKIISIKQEHKKAPYPDPAQQALMEIIGLTKDDFPETLLNIDTSGNILISDKPLLKGN
jgi:poly-gamma-glutamate capsule biosynthesis protein CapA/YwtB (metallophosphatase superfamily)